MLHKSQLPSSAELRAAVNDIFGRGVYRSGMSKVVRIHQRSTPNRPHFIPEWAERRGLKQSDIARELGADKSIVSRWFHGTSPSDFWIERLAAFFGCEKESLFRHPDDDWMAAFLRGRPAEEIERIKATLEAAFPRTATGS